MNRLAKHLVVAASLLLLLVLTAPAQTSTDKPQNEIEVHGIYSIPSGESQFSTTGSAGSVIDFGRDFDFNNALGYQLRFTHRTANGKHKFLANYADTRWSRDTTLTRSFTFLGQTYLANLNISSNLKLRDFRAMYAYRWGNDKVRFGPMGDLGVITTRLDITGTANSGTRTTEGSITKLAATVGYDLDYDPTDRINIFHNLGAIAFQGEHLFHTEGGVKVFLSNNLGVVGGYRAQRYKLKDNDNFITIRSHGPFFGGVFRF
jgi:hypothetical protein